MRYIAIHHHNGSLSCWMTDSKSADEVQEELTSAGANNETCLAVVQIPNDEGGRLIHAIGDINGQPRDALEMLITAVAREVERLTKDKQKAGK